MTIDRELAAPSSRMDLLDGLRFLAALSVLGYHFAFRSWNQSLPGVVEYPVLGHLAKYGYLGVDLFFMISGFVILMTASQGIAGKFLVSRIVRLYPAYWFCVAATFTFLSCWQWGLPEAPPLSEMLINLSMLQTPLGVANIDGSYWTLAVELNFYAIILLVLWSGKLVHIDLILGAWLLAGIAADHFPALGAVGDWYSAAWCQYFVAGALVYRMRVAGITVLRMLFFVLAFGQAARHAHWYMHLKQHLTQVSYDPWVVQGLIALLFGLFFLLALGRLQVRHSSLRFFGALTYPLYLIHGAIGTTLLVAWVNQYGANRWLALGVVTAGALAAAAAIQRFVEAPLASQLRGLLLARLAPRSVVAKT